MSRKGSIAHMRLISADLLIVRPWPVDLGLGVASMREMGPRDRLLLVAGGGRTWRSSGRSGQLGLAGRSGQLGDGVGGAVDSGEGTGRVVGQSFLALQCRLPHLRTEGMVVVTATAIVFRGVRAGVCYMYVREFGSWGVGDESTLRGMHGVPRYKTSKLKAGPIWNACM